MDCKNILARQSDIMDCKRYWVVYLPSCQNEYWKRK
jgi:hypothetical protein